MSYNGEAIKDKALEKYTLGLMEDVVRHYHNRIEDDNVDKLIERGIAKKLVDWIPEKYTEVDIKAMVGQKYTSVIAEFMIDTKTTMVVVHEEVNSVEKKRNNKLDSIFMQGELKSHPGRIYAGQNADGTYDPTSLTEDFIFPRHASSGRGSKVETLPGGQNISEMRDLEYFQHELWRGSTTPPIDFSAISGIDVEKAQEWDRKSNNYSSTYYSIDTNAVMKESILNAEKESLIESATKRLQHLADEVMFDAMVGTAGTEPTTKALTLNELQELQEKYKDWACGTSGWSDEFTLSPPKMDKDDLTWCVPVEMTWYNPYPLTTHNPNHSVVTAMEEIEFTEADLDELADFLNERKSEVMKFA